MDWRERKYYIASFSYLEYEYILSQLSCIDSVKIHHPTQFTSKNPDYIFKDEIKSRGAYQCLISCRFIDSDAVEFELRKSKSDWREVKQKIKPYSPYKGFPERRCDLNHRKRCNHCMDC